MDKVFRIGIDEVGRGSLAGPVVAVATIFLQEFDTTKLKDSKQLQPRIRKNLEKYLINLSERDILLYCYGSASVKEINEINIRNATFLAMRRAISNLMKLPQFPKKKMMHICVDGGDTIPEIEINQTAIIKGDTKIDEIKAASILAKTYRDAVMGTHFHKQYPQYNWKSNKGYGTGAHIQAIKKYGICPLHRNYKRFLEKIGVPHEAKKENT